LLFYAAAHARRPPSAVVRGWQAGFGNQSLFRGCWSAWWCSFIWGFIHATALVGGGGIEKTSWLPMAGKGKKRPRHRSFSVSPRGGLQTIQTWGAASTGSPVICRYMVSRPFSVFFGWAAQFWLVRPAAQILGPPRHHDVMAFYIPGARFVQLPGVGTGGSQSSSRLLR